MKRIVICILAAALWVSVAAERVMIPFSQIQQKWTNQPLPKITAAAEAGDVWAQHYLGRGYVEGYFGPKNPQEARKWYEMAVAKDFPNSQANLGLLLLDSEPRDKGRGMTLLRAAAETGDANVLFNLGDAFLADQNYAEAKENFEKAADKGNASAMFAMGDLYYYGRLERDYNKAYAWYKKVADTGHVEAMARLVELLAIPHSLDSPVRVEEARQWRSKAEARGWHFDYRAFSGQLLREALDGAERAKEPTYELAENLELGRGTPKDEQRAYSLYLQLADESVRAAFKVGWMYENGKGVRKDDAKALQLYARAARSMDLTKQGPFSRRQEAEEAILRLLSQGRGLRTPAENMRVIGILEPRNADGSGDYNVMLGRMFDEGKIVPADLPRAVRFYSAAAQSGSAEALNRLGELWEEGADGKTDPAEAVSWYRAAAEKQYAKGQFNLGRIYANGTGVPKDMAAAQKWLSQAAGQGENRAAELLKKLGLSSSSTK